MTDHQWRMLVRTFWAIVLIAIIVGGVALWTKAQNDAERKAKDDVCRYMEEFNVEGDDC